MTTISEIKGQVKKLVLAKQGCKAGELVAEMTKWFVEKGDSSEDLLFTIDAMVSDGELIEVEYSLPNMSYRLKSFYFPVDTEVRIIAKEKRPPTTIKALPTRKGWYNIISISGPDADPGPILYRGVRSWNVGDEIEARYIERLLPEYLPDSYKIIILPAQNFEHFGDSSAIMGAPDL